MASVSRSKILEELFGTSQISTQACGEMVDQHFTQSLQPKNPTKMSFPYTAEGKFDPPLPTPKDVAGGEHISGYSHEPS